MRTAMSAEEAQPHGHTRNSQAFGNFLGGVLQDIAEETCLPEIRRELRDGACEERAHFATRVIFLRSIPMGGKMLGKVFARFRIAVLKGDVSGVAPLAKQVDGSIRGDARDPSVEVVLEFILTAGKLIDAREGLHQRILLRVFGVSRIPGQPQCAAIKTWRVG